VKALERGDLAALGEAVDRSQRAAERFLGNQVPETIELARSARALGARAASAFGGGYGGSVWALVDSSDAGAFRSAWESIYHRRFPETRGDEFFITGAGPGRLRL
jgi:galactokinase